MTKAIDAAAAGRSGHGVNDEGNKENRHGDAKTRFKSEEEWVSKDDLIELTKAEMGEVRRENERLRTHLERLTKDYQTLQTQFQDVIVQQEATGRSGNYNVTLSTAMASSSLSSQQDVEEHDISLRLGRTSSSSFKREVTVMNKSEGNDDERGLALGLDSSSKPLEGSKTDHRSSTEPLTNNTSTDNSFDQEEKKEDIMGETNWPPPKMVKRSAEDEIDSQHNNGKRARVSVRARCDTPTMNDGCQWRKYGQKIAKGNPCPRAYYRCTVAPSCPVRKQVQRCAEDMSILITTYEGTHNHPLAAAATAMASTTSAAASMLLSGSISARPAGLSQPTTSATTTSAGLHGLTCYDLANGMTSSQPSRPQQFYIQNTSHISSSPNTHPTITLDLTTSNPFASPFANQHFNRFSSSTSYDPSHSSIFSSKSTSLNFASIDSNNPQAASLSWATNNHNNALGYMNLYPQSNNRNNHNLGSLTLASSGYPQENIYQSFMQKPNSALHINHHQQQQQQQPELPDRIAAATKAITADPSFQTAIAAALSSIIGGTSGGVSTNNNNSEKVHVSTGMENLGQKLKWMDHKGINGCGSSYLSSASSVSNAQTNGHIFLQPSNSAASKRKSTSPCENKQDHNAS